MGARPFGPLRLGRRRLSGRADPVVLGPPGPEPGARGRFGDFGGRFVPETLVPALDQLERSFRAAWSSDAFRSELAALLSSYAGRPTPVTECKRLSERLGVRVILKREDLAHPRTFAPSWWGSTTTTTRRSSWTRS